MPLIGLKIDTSSILTNRPVVLMYFDDLVLFLQVLTTAIAKGQLSQNLHSRVASCKILGKTATRFDSFM